MNRGIPLYPIILALALVLAITLTTSGSPYAGIRLYLAFAVGALLVCVVARLLLGDRDRAGVAATLLVLFAFRGYDWRVAILLLAAVGLVVAERLVATRRPSRISWPLVGRVMNAGSVVVLVAVLLRSAGDGSLGPFLGSIRNEGPTALRESVVRAAARPATGTPDVYLFILDGHARADKLEKIFGHDQTPFLSALEDRGFDVAAASRSNYLLTAQSLTSMFNMAHVNDVMHPVTSSASSIGFGTELRRLTSNSRVFDEFRGVGYDVVAISSGFEIMAPRGADRFIDTGQINELELRTLGNTAIAPAIQLLDPDWFAAQHRSRVLSVFDAAAAVAREPHDRPRFLMAHVPSPHAPIIFAADGSPVPMSDLPNFYEDTYQHRPLPRQQALAQYAGQVAYIDGLALTAIDRVKEASTTPPIILVISDHGSAAGLSWTDLERSDLDERTANLFAASTPGVTGLYPDDITLVNVFGRLFEAYFGRPYQALPDTTYSLGSSVADEIPFVLPGTETP